MNRPQFPKNLIQRDTYISRIIPFIRKPIVKVLTGQRQVGKSNMMFLLIQRILKGDSNANIIYINKENLTFDNLKTVSDLNQFVLEHSNDKKTNYIFIDGIQEIPEFEKAVRSLLINTENDIYITGSSEKLLSSEISTYLGGRIIEFKIYCLSYSEFLLFHSLIDSDENFLRFCKYGGHPFLSTMELNDDWVFEFLKSIYITNVDQDLVNSLKIRYPNLLTLVIYYFTKNIGTLYSVEQISKFLKSQTNYLNSDERYPVINYISKVFLIHKVKHIDILSNLILSLKGENYYFEDLGICNCITEFLSNVEEKYLENVVYNQLIYKGYDVNIGCLESEEIGFVATKYNERIYVKVAFHLDNEEAMEQVFGKLFRINDNYPKMVISLDENVNKTYDGITHIPIRKFLMM